MPAGYTDEEFSRFSKTEKRMLHMIVALKYEKEAIMGALDIKYSTFRGHIASIKRKQAEIKKARFENQAAIDAKRQSASHLPEFETAQEEGEGASKNIEEAPPIAPSPEAGVEKPESFSPTIVPLEEIPFNVEALPRSVGVGSKFGSI